MTDYKVEINRDGWKALELRSSNKIKYNLLVNSIESPASRKISHSNTYELKRTLHNIQALNLNIFNPSRLAKSLNTKYPCRVRVREKVRLEGYLVINNVQQNSININIVDKSLDLLEQLSAVTLKDVLNNNEFYLRIQTDYRTVLDQMKNYAIGNGSTILPLLPQMPNKNFYLSIFPTTLNMIGEKFNKDLDNTRFIADRLNAFQSRPLWSEKAILDICCESMGYTYEYLPGVSESTLKNSFIVPDIPETADIDRLLKTYVMDEKLPYVPYDFYYRNLSNIEAQVTIAYDDLETRAISSNYIQNVLGHTWTYPFGAYPGVPTDAKTVFMPNVEDSYKGKVKIKADLNTVGSPTGYSNMSVLIRNFAVYSRAGGGTIIYKELVTLFQNWEPYFASGNLSNWTNVLPIWNNQPFPIQFDMEFDKEQIGEFPLNAQDLLGFTTVIQAGYTNTTDSYLRLYPRGASETYVPGDVDFIVFNENLEFPLNTTQNLTYLSPTASLKDLFSKILSQQGLLVAIDGNKNHVKFYTYDYVKNRILSRDVEDWSGYLLEDEIITRDIDFGASFGKLNKISLTDPYPGNTFKLTLSNHGEMSKIVDEASFTVTGLKDVKGVSLVNVGGSKLYFEYTCEGLSLVDLAGVITNLVQSRADKTEVTGLSAYHVQNINYLNLQPGIRSWYEIVDKGLRIKAKLRLPNSTINEFDITKPIYLKQIGHSLIIEKISEYEDYETPVEVSFLLPGVYYSQFI